MQAKFIQDRYLTLLHGLSPRKPENAFPATVQCLIQRIRKGLCTISERSHKHRHINASQTFYSAGTRQAARYVAWRCPADIAQYENTIPLIELLS
jgi:hypothetical protein